MLAFYTVDLRILRDAVRRFRCSQRHTGQCSSRWLLIFLVQSWLVATPACVAWHKRLGLASIFILAVMIPLAYETTIGMVKRGFDLSGDLTVGTGDDLAYQAVFPLFNILIFAALVIAALAYRSRPEVHKRLMLFANIELMPAPLAHIIGHHPLLAALPPPIVNGPYLDVRDCGGREETCW